MLPEPEPVQKNCQLNFKPEVSAVHCYKTDHYSHSPNLACDASDGSGDFKSRLELGRNCRFAGLIFGRSGFRFGRYARCHAYEFQMPKLSDEDLQSCSQGLPYLWSCASVGVFVARGADSLHRRESQARFEGRA
jgi:hypothetical protein